jgi:bisphosphoglycerate-dependent phosphoglycerate mutase
VDIVAAPSGSRTGQAWSQAEISSMSDIKRLNEVEDEILNSADDCTGHGKFKDEMNAKYKDAKYCILCFRLFTARPQEEANKEIDNEKLWVTQWVVHDCAQVLMFINERWQPPYYQELIKEMLPETGVVSVCKHCSEYIRRVLKDDVVFNMPDCEKPSIPMHIAIRYIMSGGCTQSPCRKMLAHCIESLCYKFPSNPILQFFERTEERGLSDKMQIIGKNLDVFHDESVPNHVFIGVAKWLTEGSQHFQTDAAFARVMRQIMEKHENVVQWWKDRVMPNIACKDHMAIMTPDNRGTVKEMVSKHENIGPAAYSMVLVYGSKSPKIRIQQKLEEIEAEKFLMDGISCFCMVCSKVSVMSYEYDLFLKTAAGGQCITPHRDIYYDKAIRRAKRSRREQAPFMVVDE